MHEQVDQWLVPALAIVIIFLIVFGVFKISVLSRLPLLDYRG
jgi:hypothetical protein